MKTYGQSTNIIGVVGTLEICGCGVKLTFLLLERIGFNEWLSDI